MTTLLSLTVCMIVSPSSVSSQTTLSETQYDSVLVNGISLAYRVIGDGEPLVLLHGGLGTGEEWSPLFDDFSTHYRLIVPDLRWHGRSTNPQGLFSYEDMASDIFALLDHLGIGKVRVIGFSMGGLTLMHMAIGQPERLETIVFLSGALGYLPVWYRQQLRSLTVPPEAMEQLAQLHRGGEEQVRRILLSGKTVADDYENLNFSPPQLSTISAPSLIVVGDHEFGENREQSREFLLQAFDVYDAIPDSYLWVVPNGGHTNFPRSEPALSTFKETVLAFLAGEWK